MPPFANGLDSFSGLVQEQPVTTSNLDQVSSTELRSSPACTNFFKTNVFRDDMGNPVHVQMVELLQSGQRIHGMGSQALLTLAGMSGWETVAASRVGVSHDFSLNFDRNRGDTDVQIPKEDRSQLGMLLSRPVSPSDDYSSQGLVRKRSLSSMLESEDFDQSRALRSYTSSESDPGAGEDTHFSAATPSRSPVKVQKTSRLDASNIGKDLLSLSLPVSSLHSESSSSSRERDDSQMQTKSEQSFIPFRSCKVHPSADNDGAESDVLDEKPMLASLGLLTRHYHEEDVKPIIPSTSLQIRHDNDNDNDKDVDVQEQRAVSGDDAAGETSTYSSTGPTSLAMYGDDVDNEPAILSTLQFEALKPALNHDQDVKRGKLQPLKGLDMSALKQHSLLMRDLDTGVEAHGLQLVHLLLKCADATAKENVDLAASILRELYQTASLYGDSMQRVAAYFAEGLAARIVTKKSPAYASLMIQPSTFDYLCAFTTLYKVAPYFQFAHFTANQAILEALEGHTAVHVVDLDIMQGFQWPSLIQSLAARPGGPPHLRITGVGKHADIVGETGRRLTSFAASFEVQFEFHALVEENLENLTPEALDPRFGEVIAVNSVLQLHRLLNPSSGENLHKFLQSLCTELKPCVVTLVEQEANHNASSFLGRFMEALHYYAAVFDSLDASLPQQNDERVKIEQLLFAQQIKNIVVCEGDERVERHETVDLWQQRMEMAGFFQVPLSSHSVSQAKLLLQFCPCEGYRLHERNGSISLGWQERQLLTASAWSC